MRIWVGFATFILFKTLSDHSSTTKAAFMAENPAQTPDPANPPRETPSPHPFEQPSSGPNPEFLPTPKKRGRPSVSINNTKRRKTAPVDEEEEADQTPEQIAEGSRLMRQKLAEAAAEKAAEAKAKAEAERSLRVRASLEALKNAGCTTTYQFFEDFFASTDQQVSRQASRLLSDHGTDLLDLLHAKRPDVVERWAMEASLPIIAAEGKNLADLLRPDPEHSYTSRLESWSLETMISKATIAAPNLCELLMLMGMTSDVGRQDNKLVHRRPQFSYFPFSRLTGSCHGALHARAVAERTCQWLSRNYGHILPCMQHSSPPI